MSAPELAKPNETGQEIPIILLAVGRGSPSQPFVMAPDCRVLGAARFVIEDAGRGTPPAFKLGTLYRLEAQ
ncbi:hypothetical protein JCM2811A_07280 [Methylorubrum rhodinum]